MEKAKESIHSLRASWINQMDIIKDKTGIKGVYVVVALLIAISFVYLNIFDKLITNLVGTVYPAFWTMKSIESKTDDSRLWLCYWVVFVSFSLFDLFSPIIIKLFPLYFLFKILFLLWLFMPNSLGCTYVYNLIIKQLFQSYESNLDIAAGKVKEYLPSSSKTKKALKVIQNEVKDKDRAAPYLEDKLKEMLFSKE